MMKRYMAAWLPMVALAVLNGALRQYVLLPLVSEITAHQISTFTLMLLFTAYLWPLLRRRPPRSDAHAAAVGLLWLGMTVGFEFGFGHYVMGHPWDRLLRDYNLCAGRLWVLILLYVAAAPWVLRRLLLRRGGPALARGT